MAGERIKLFEADIDVEGIIKKSVELREEMEDLKFQQKALKLTVGTTNEEYIKAEARLKKVSAEYRVNQQQVSNLAGATGDFLSVEQKLTAAIDKQIVSEAQAIENNKELRRIKKDVNVTTEEGKKAVEEINKKLDQNTEFLKENADSYVRQKLSIGDYKNQIIDAYKEMETQKQELEDNNKALLDLQKQTEKGSDEWKYFNSQIEQNNTQINVLINGLGGVNEEMQSTSSITNLLSGNFRGLAQDAEKVGGAGNLIKITAKGAATSIMGMVKASLAFIATPVGAVIAAIGLVLGAVIGYLKNTQAGIDAVTAVTRPLSAIFEALIGILQEVGEFLFEAFSNPQETLKELYEFVKEQLMRQFESFGKILEGIATLDFSKVKEGFNDLSDQATENINRIAGAVGEIGDRFEDAFKKGQRIDQLQKLQEQREIDIIAYRAEQERQLKVLENIQKNQLLSADERNAAIAEGEKIAKELVARENEILDLQIEQLKLKQSLNDTSREEEKELQELIAQRIKNTEKILDVEKRALGDRKQLATEQQNLAKKAFDDSIKRQQTELQIYLESQGIKKKTITEELALAEEAFKRELEIEKQKLKAKKITREEFELFVIKSEKELAEIRIEIAEQSLDEELEAFKKAHEEKLENDTFFSEESLRIEQERLALLLEQEQAYWDAKLELGVINQDDYNKEINKIIEANQDALDEALAQRAAAQKEKEAIDLANKRAAQIENLDYDLEFQLQELDAKRRQELEAAEKTGADLALIEAKYAKQRTEIEERVQASKISIYSQTAGNFVTILGKQSALGKAAAIVQTTIDTYQSAVAAYKAMVGIPVVGPTLATIAAGAAVAGGLANVKKIAGIKPPKAERGMSLDIGGKRHSQGGTKFFGEDGTAFEAEKGEKMFILNRQASAALTPLLSDINQQYGGVSLSRSSSYLASGGQILRSSLPQSNQIDIDKIYEAIGEGAKEGSRQGAMEGSSRGTYSGMVDREANEAIAAGANF